MPEPFSAVGGATLIDADAAAALMPPLQTQAELNEFEAANIIDAVRWVRRSRQLRRFYPSPNALIELHRRMFNRTWRWAGRYRRTDTNLGIAWQEIPVAVRELCDDVSYQLERASLDSEHLSAGFHHRLVSIHSFPNGNGRHARIATDVLRRNGGWPAWTWGADSLTTEGPTRRGYIDALRAADVGDRSALIAFAQTRTK